jgi:ABC-type Zn uptake system ZnuABC Zn-binding protein ZnuA
MDRSDKLYELQDLLIEEFLLRVKSGEASTADLSTVRQFLKDNNVSAVVTESSPLHELVNSLPFHDDNVDRIVDMAANE